MSSQASDLTSFTSAPAVWVILGEEASNPISFGRVMIKDLEGGEIREVFKNPSNGKILLRG